MSHSAAICKFHDPPSNERTAMMDVLLDTWMFRGCCRGPREWMLVHRVDLGRFEVDGNSTKSCVYKVLMYFNEIKVHSDPGSYCSSTSSASVGLKNASKMKISRPNIKSFNKHKIFTHKFSVDRHHHVFSSKDKFFVPGRGS